MQKNPKRLHLSKTWSSENKHTIEDIISNSDNYREGNISSFKPNTADENIIISIV